MNNIIGWNVRGLNSGTRVADLKKVIEENKAGLVGLMETRVKAKNVSRIMHNLPAQCKVANNYDHSRKGLLWVLWNENFWLFFVSHLSDQEITGQCQNSWGFSFHISFVYGFNSESQRKGLWQTLRNLHKSIPKAWVVVGDFNTVKELREKLGGRDLTEARIADFNSCIEDCGLVEMRSVGPIWSWSNSSYTSQRIVGRLDRSLVNQEWINRFPNAYAEYLPTLSSDHSPQRILFQQIHSLGVRPF